MAETKTRSMRLDRCALFLSIACASVALASGDSALAAPTAAKPAPAAKAPKKGDKKAAGALFKKGKELFEAKDYAGAKASFMEAEDILPGAPVEYWTGRCLEELGDYSGAVASYEKALLDPKLKSADDAKDRVGKLKVKPMKVKITSGDAPGASIKVDGAAIADKTPAEVELAPGAHKITLTAAGMKDGAGDVTVVALTPGAFDLKLEAVPATPPPPPDGPAPGVVAVPAPTPSPAMTAPPPTTTTTAPPAESSDKTWAYVTGGVAIVGLGVGTYFGIQAMSDHSNYTAAGGATADLRDTGTHHALISDIGFGIGLTLAITSLVLYFGGDDSPESSITSPPIGAPIRAKSAAFAPFVSPSIAGKPASAGAMATFQF
ncbi:MAG: tol-pal system YbgF family protein [Polyangiales bacterium]